MTRLRLGAPLVMLAALAAGCYQTPQPNCAFSCGPSGECPPSYVCIPDDNVCHLQQGSTLLACEPGTMPDGQAPAIDAPVVVRPDALPKPDAPVGMTDAAVEVPDAPVVEVPDTPVVEVPDAPVVEPPDAPPPPPLDAATPDVPSPDARVLPDATPPLDAAPPDA